MRKRAFQGRANEHVGKYASQCRVKAKKEGERPAYKKGNTELLDHEMLHDSHFEEKLVKILSEEDIHVKNA